MSAFFGCRMMITMTHTFVCNFPCNLKEQWIIHVSLWHMFCWGGKKRRKEKITIEWEKIGKRPVFKQSLLLFSNSLSHAHTTLAHKKAKERENIPIHPIISQLVPSILEISDLMCEKTKFLSSNDPILV